jgi:lipoate-protein ligase A
MDGRKLVGSAQWRDEGAMLQHGSILIEDDQPLVSAIAGGAVSPPHPAATLTAALGRSPTVEEIAASLFAAVRALECRKATELSVDESVDRSMRGALDRYRDDQWTWRR